MELSMREKELLIMFGSERRLDTHKRLQNRKWENWNK